MNADQRRCQREGTRSRRGFLQGAALTAAGLGALASRTQAAPSGVPAERSGKPRLRDLGWVWEGQGIDPKVPPSIYGLGQGARYFGLSRVHYLFHPNDEHALRLMCGYDEVVCDITKWIWEWDAQGRPKCRPQSDPATIRSEGETVARLAGRFPNVTGVYCDDLLGLMKSFKFGPAEFGNVRAAIRAADAKLKLWSVVYTHELEQVEFWTAMRPHMDVVTLWIWKSENLGRMPEEVERCRRLFPDKPIVMGVYLRDYTKVAPVDVELVKRQMEGVAELIRKDKLAGYTILAAVLIDGHRAQADAVRDFIAAESGPA